MGRLKPKSHRKITPPESAGQRFLRLSQLKILWRIEVPFYARDAAGRHTDTIDISHYPPEGVKAYSFKEAVGLLEIFCQRFTENGRLPPAKIEPVAIEIPIKERVVDGAHPLLRFTLKEVDSITSRWVETSLTSAATRKPMTPAECDEDEADRWLREHGNDSERFLDL